MLNTKFLNTIVDKISHIFPEESTNCRKELQHQLNTLLQATFAQLDLVTREEFEAQKNVLLRTRQKLEALMITLEKMRQDLSSE